MAKVILVDNSHYREDDTKITIRLPLYQYLVFDIDIGDIIGGIFGDVDYSDEDFIGFLSNDNKLDEVVNSATKDCLRKLAYTLYITTNTLEEIARRLNIADLEYVIETMIFDEVIEKMTLLYEDYKEKDELN